MVLLEIAGRILIECATNYTNARDYECPELHELHECQNATNYTNLEELFLDNF